MNIRPLYDRILIKRIVADETTKSGLYIPPTAKEKPQEGVVIAVGNGKVLDTGIVHLPEVKVGDRVLFAKYGGTETKVDDSEHLILREDEVLAVITD